MTRLQEQNWGQADGQAVKLFTLTNRKGTVVKVTNFGLIITDIQTADRHGKLGHIALGFDSLEQYQKGHPFFGAIAGAIPLIFSHGAGSETRAAIGVVILFGVLTALAVTLILVPAAYSLLARHTGSPRASTRSSRSERAG